MKEYDFIIVGSGISGLYFSYKIKQKYPHKTILILEKNKKDFLGGRAGNDNFQGTNVVIGAGIGRFKKDKLLKKLMQEFNIPIKTYTVHPKYSPIFEPISIQDTINLLKSKYHGEAETFKQFALRHLSPTEYRQFIQSVGYTDYEEEDAEDVLNNYGMEDNYCCYQGFSVPWKILIHKMADYIGMQNIRFNAEVNGIRREAETENIIVKINGSTEIAAKQLVLATTIDTVQKMFQRTHPIYKQIRGQPFLRLYAKFDKKSAEIIKSIITGYTIVSSPLQKIIPMSDNVFMIAYSDNKNALYMKKYMQNTEQNRHICAKLVEKSIGLSDNSLRIIALRPYYWNIGTHYCVPLDKTKYNNRRDFLHEIQRPAPGIFIVGEAVSINQGWVEGALNSVKQIL